MLAPKNTVLQGKIIFDLGLEIWVSVDLEDVGAGSGELLRQDQYRYTPKWQREPCLIEV